IGRHRAVRSPRADAVDVGTTHPRAGSSSAATRSHDHRSAASCHAAAHADEPEPPMSTRLHVRLAVVLACAIAAPATPSLALADESAAALKQRGDAAMDSLRYDDAIAAYEKAYAISKDPAILYNLGRVHQARGVYPKALEYLERFDREAPPELKSRVPLLAS